MTNSSYQLVVRKGPQLGQVFPLSSESMSIGRDPMSDITISDPEVSRYHAQLLLTDEGFQIQDMGSTNGTYIDGEHLGGQPALLTSGQTIQLGSGVVLRFEAVAEGEDVMATAAETAPEAQPEDEVPIAAEPAPEAPAEEQPAAVPPKQLEPRAASSAYEAPPPAQPPSPPLVAPGEGQGPGKRRRTIIIISFILLLCCCCVFLLSGYFVWGDPLLDLLIDLGLMNWLRDLGVVI